MKLELPNDINLLALHHFAQEQGCRIHQTANGSLAMRRTILKFPVRRLTTRPNCKSGLTPDDKGAA